MPGALRAVVLCPACRIRCRLHTKVPQVDSIMSRRLQAFGKERGQVVVDEEFHAVCRSGSSR